MSGDRRRAPRVETFGRVRGRLLSLDTEVSIREISLGGLSLESPVQFQVGAVHQFELLLGDGARVAVTAEARYSRRASTGESGGYVTGFQFIDEDAEAGAAVTGLVDGLA